MPFTQPINLELGLGGDADDNGRQQGGQRNRQQQSRRQPSPAAAPQPLNLTGGSQYVATPQADGAIFSWEKPVTLPIPSGDRRGRTRVGDGTGAGAGSALPVLVGRRRDVLAAAGGKDSSQDGLPTVTTTSTNNQHKRRSVTDAVDWAADKVPLIGPSSSGGGRHSGAGASLSAVDQGAYLSLGVHQPRAEITANRHDTARILARLQVAFAALPDSTSAAAAAAGQSSGNQGRPREYGASPAAREGMPQLNETWHDDEDNEDGGSSIGALTVDSGFREIDGEKPSAQNWRTNENGSARNARGGGRSSGGGGAMVVAIKGQQQQQQQQNKARESSANNNNDQREVSSLPAAATPMAGEAQMSSEWQNATVVARDTLAGACPHVQAVVEASAATGGGRIHKSMKGRGRNTTEPALGDEVLPLPENEEAAEGNLTATTAVAAAALAAEVLPSLNLNAWQAQSEAYARASFTAKHLDLFAAALTDQVSVLSVEQGKLMASLRARMGTEASIQQASSRATLALLEACCQSLVESRTREDRWEQKHASAMALAMKEASDREAHLMLKVQEGEAALQRQKEESAREAAKHLHSLRSLQAIITDLQGDGQNRDLIDLRQQLKKANAERKSLEQQLEQLQPIREKAAEARVLGMRLNSAMGEVERLQGELNKRDLQLKGALNGSADKTFAAAAGLASSGEKAVVQLACLDPTVDSDALLPASKPVPGTLLCVRCEKSLNQVASSEADVTRANALETARPCKEFVQLLGPIPRGLRLLPFKPTVKPPSAEELAKRKEAAEAEETLRLNAIAAAELAGWPPPEPEPEPEPEDDGSFAALEAEEAVNDPTIPGPFHLWPLRKALSNGPPCRLRRAPLTLLAYPDWRQWRPGALATASASSADTELDERDLIDEDEDELDAEQRVRLKDEWLLPPDDQVFVRSVEAAAANRGVQGGIAPSLRFTDPETSLAVFHGASPWWIRLICRALLMARIDDVLVRNRAFSTSPDSPTFSDFCWAWFEPTPEMRDAYLAHRLEQQRLADLAANENNNKAASGSSIVGSVSHKSGSKDKKTSSLGPGNGRPSPPVPELSEASEARRWLFFDGLRRLAAPGGSRTSEATGLTNARKEEERRKAQDPHYQGRKMPATASSVEPEEANKRAGKVQEARNKPSDPEASLVWALLDGRGGGDYERFALHCLQTLESSYPYSDGRFRAVLGCAASAPDYAALTAAMLEFEATCGGVAQGFQTSDMDHGSDSGATPKLTLPLSATQLASHTVPTKMWAPLWAVLQATRVLLTQAPPHVRDRVLVALPALALEAEGRLPPRPPPALVSSATGVKDQAQRQQERDEKIAASAGETDGDGNDAAEDPLENEEAERCVDIFLWLKIMMKCFKEEQVNREAAVRLMFSTAEHGNKSKETLARQAADRRAGVEQSSSSSPSSSNSEGPEKYDPATAAASMITSSQAVAIARTLDPHCSAAQAVAIYRSAAEMGVKAPSADDLIGVPLRAVPVTADLFLRAASKHGLLVSGLDLSGLPTSHRRCAEEAQLDARGSEQVGSLVHLRVNLLRPFLESTLNRLPETSKYALASAVRDVYSALGQAAPRSFGSDPLTKSKARKKKPKQKKAALGADSSSDAALSASARAGGALTTPKRPMPAVAVAGVAALVAYRRLLALLLRLRHANSEAGRLGVFPAVALSAFQPVPPGRDAVSNENSSSEDLVSGNTHISFTGANANAAAVTTRRTVARVATELLAAECAVFPTGSQPIRTPGGSGFFVPPVQASRQQQRQPQTPLLLDMRQRLRPLQTSIAASRLELWWRRRLAQASLTQYLPPLKVLAALGKPGWLAGRSGGLKGRRNHWPAKYTQAALAGLVGCWLAHPHAPDGPLATHQLGGYLPSSNTTSTGSSSSSYAGEGAATTSPNNKKAIGWGASPGLVSSPSMGEVLVALAIRLFGQPTLAERWVADFCFNVANLQLRLPRARLVCLLLGGIGSSAVSVTALRSQAEAELQLAALALENAKKEVSQSNQSAPSLRLETNCRKRYNAALIAAEAVGASKTANTTAAASSSSAASGSKDPGAANGKVSKLEAEIRDHPEDSARFYACATAAMSRAASARETVVLSVANLASSLAAGAVCDACTNIKDTMHAKEALAAEANAKAGRKKRKPRADPKAEAAAVEAHAKAKRDLTDLAAQCAQEAALGCSRELFMSTCFQRVRIWGDRPQDSARRLARETKLALTGKKGEKPAAFFTTNLLATALSTAEVAKADRIKMAKAKARAAAAARGEAFERQLVAGNTNTSSSESKAPVPIKSQEGETKGDVENDDGDHNSDDDEDASGTAPTSSSEGPTDDLGGWRMGMGALLGEAAVSAGERQRLFGGSWFNYDGGLANGSGSALDALVNLFQPRYLPLPPVQPWVSKHAKPGQRGGNGSNNGSSDEAGGGEEGGSGRRSRRNESPAKERGSSRSARGKKSDTKGADAEEATAVAATDETAAKKETAGGEGVSATENTAAAVAVEGEVAGLAENDGEDYSAVALTPLQELFGVDYDPVSATTAKMNASGPLPQDQIVRQQRPQAANPTAKTQEIHARGGAHSMRALILDRLKRRIRALESWHKDTGSVDVDDVLWCVMQEWAEQRCRLKAMVHRAAAVANFVPSSSSSSLGIGISNSGSNEKNKHVKIGRSTGAIAESGSVIVALSVAQAAWNGTQMEMMQEAMLFARGFAMGSAKEPRKGTGGSSGSTSSPSKKPKTKSGSSSSSSGGSSISGAPPQDDLFGGQSFELSQPAFASPSSAPVPGWIASVGSDGAACALMQQFQLKDEVMGSRSSDSESAQGGNRRLILMAQAACLAVFAANTPTTQTSSSSGTTQLPLLNLRANGEGNAGAAPPSAAVATSKLNTPSLPPAVLLGPRFLGPWLRHTFEALEKPLQHHLMSMLEIAWKDAVKLEAPPALKEEEEEPLSGKVAGKSKAVANTAAAQRGKVNEEEKDERDKWGVRQGVTFKTFMAEPPLLLSGGGEGGATVDILKWCVWELKALRQHLDACGAIREEEGANKGEASLEQALMEATDLEDKEGAAFVEKRRAQQHHQQPLPSAQEFLFLQATARAEGPVAMNTALSVGSERLRILLAETETACLRVTSSSNSSGGSSFAKPFPPRDVWASGQRPQLLKAQHIPVAWPPPPLIDTTKRD